MEKILYDVVCEENAKTGKRNVIIVSRYTNLSKDEAIKKAEELMGEDTYKLPTKNKIEEYFKFIGAYNQNVFENKPTSIAFDEYVSWCYASGYKNMSNVEFGRIVCNWLSYETKVARIEGKTKRVFKKL